MFAQSDQLKILLTTWLVPTPQQQHNLSIVNPNVFIHGTASQWAPMSTLYPAQATVVDRAEMWMCKPYHTDIVHPPPLIVVMFELYLSTLDEWDALLLQDMVLH
eukprot:8890321-Ditylum_brightwellii.AAC.1